VRGEANCGNSPRLSRKGGGGHRTIKSKEDSPVSSQAGNLWRSGGTRCTKGRSKKGSNWSKRIRGFRRKSEEEYGGLAHDKKGSGKSPSAMPKSGHTDPTCRKRRTESWTPHSTKESQGGGEKNSHHEKGGVIDVIGLGEGRSKATNSLIHGGCAEWLTYFGREKS